MYIQLSSNQIIKIHDYEIAESGGLVGIKDRGYIDLIADKPFSDLFGEEQYPGLFLKAAVLMHGLILAHSFNDGNKRTAVVCTYAFLQLNGYELDIDDEDLFYTAIDVATKEIGLKDLAEILETNSYPI